MTKQEFIEKLRVALTGRVPAALVADNTDYYEEYIDAEIRKGRSEEEILASLGDPRLIAKTIIQTSGRSGSTARSAEYQGNAYQESDYRDTAYRNNAYHNTDYGNRHRGIAIPGWLAGILILLIVVLVVIILFSVLSFLMPVILVLAAVIFMVKLFRDWLN